MRKRLSKRRIWARFLAGKWCDEYEMMRHDLDMRAIGMDVEFNLNSVRLRRKERNEI